MENIQSLRNFLKFKLYAFSQVQTNGLLQCITFYNYENDSLKMVAQINNMDELQANEELLKCDFTKLMYSPAKGTIRFINIDFKNNTITNSNLDASKSLKEKRSEGVTPVQTVEEAMSDPNCKYYRFEGGTIGKYDPSTLLYYILEPDNTWKVNFRIYDRLIDAQYDYEEIPSSKKQSGGLGK